MLVFQQFYSYTNSTLNNISLYQLQESEINQNKNRIHIYKKI